MEPRSLLRIMNRWHRKINPKKNRRKLRRQNRLQRSKNRSRSRHQSQLHRLGQTRQYSDLEPMPSDRRRQVSLQKEQMTDCRPDPQARLLQPNRLGQRCLRLRECPRSIHLCLRLLNCHLSHAHQPVIHPGMMGIMRRCPPGRLLPMTSIVRGEKVLLVPRVNSTTPGLVDMSL